MSIQTQGPAYILGQSSCAEFRLELLDELTCPKFVEALGVLPKRKMRILIIGCGSGHLEARLAELFSESRFVGIDFSAKRIEEARVRMGALKSSNTFDFKQGDLTTLAIQELEPCDILISRFVLSHLASPIQQLRRFLPLVGPGGFVCLEEVASEGTEYYCNTNNRGYRAFVGMVEIQLKAQNSSFDTGFKMLTELSNRPGKVLHDHLTQAILKNARHKSILRLGIEDSKATYEQQLGKDKVEEVISALREFEEDETAFGLYTRSLAVIAQYH